MGEEKFCPLRMAAGAPIEGKKGEIGAECIKSDCAWWVNTYTTEGRQISGCAVHISARREANTGRVIV